MKINHYKLAQQKVQAFASLSVCDPYIPCRTEDKWFLIRTSWLGDKWICPYEYAEASTTEEPPQTVEVYVEQLLPLFMEGQQACEFVSDNLEELISGS